MTSIIDIGNLALRSLGTRSTIQSLTEGSPEADSVAQWFDTTRQQILRMAPWGFARAYKNLALLKAAPGTPENPNGSPSGVWTPAYPPPPWLYSYAYPDDCLFARFVVPSAAVGGGGVPIFSANLVSPISPSGPPVKSIVSSDLDANGNRIKIICTNQPQATLCYTTDITDPNLWDQGFQQSMIYGLAAAMAIDLTGDKSLYKLRAADANANVMQGRAMAANENLVVQNILPDWIRARGFNHSWDGTIQMLDQYAPLFPVAV